MKIEINKINKMNIKYSAIEKCEDYLYECSKLISPLIDGKLNNIQRLYIRIQSARDLIRLIKIDEQNK